MDLEKIMAKMSDAYWISKKTPIVRTIVEKSEQAAAGILLTWCMYKYHSGTRNTDSYIPPVNYNFDKSKQEYGIN